MSSQSAYPQPQRRPLKIFAFDPMLGRTLDNRITIDVINEPLNVGPQGSRIEVIDYDGPNRRYYKSVDLNDKAILMQGGLDPAEADPRFHQQMVYAVAMKVLENFDQSLGRKLKFIERSRGTYRNVPLRIFPHAFEGANAFYDPGLVALLFGYFRADTHNPGSNLPGQTVFTCLSHDIIAHETTHAVVDRLKRYFNEPSNGDVLAFHEGFADIVAIFQHFAIPNLLRTQLQKAHLNLREPAPLVTLAQQFGYATGSGTALRSAVDKPDPTLYRTVTEVHERGSILVAAVFDAFFVTYQKRIAELVRIATGGTGRLPEGDLLPDLVDRVANEAAQTAQSILTMCIRAFDYLPPIDITFGDYLRALVTADRELLPSDQFEQRAAMIEAFRVRGIYPGNVISLSEECLVWESAEDKKLPPFPGELLRDQVVNSAQALSFVDEEAPPNINSIPKARRQMHDWAKANAPALGLDRKLAIETAGFHASFRISPQGQLLVDTVAQFVQTQPDSGKDFGGVPFRGGTTVIASANGTVRYIITKPLPSRNIGKALHQDAKHRLARQQEFVNHFDLTDPQLPWYKSNEYQNRISMAMSFAALHANIIR